MKDIITNSFSDLFHYTYYILSNTLYWLISRTGVLTFEFPTYVYTCGYHLLILTPWWNLNAAIIWKLVSCFLPDLLRKDWNWTINIFFMQLAERNLFLWWHFDINSDHLFYNSSSSRYVTTCNFRVDIKHIVSNCLKNLGLFSALTMLMLVFHLLSFQFQ